MHIEVETQNVDGQVTALGSAGPFTLVVDRPVEGGGGGLELRNGVSRMVVGAPDTAKELPRLTPGDK
jgi:hypothetical protein